VEIIEGDRLSRDGLVEIAFAETREEAALMRGLLREDGIRSLAKQTSINGPALGAGLLTSSSRRIYVRPDDAEAARKLLAETMVEDPLEEEIPEPANAEYLADATGHKPRDYGVLGAYARAYVVTGAIFGLALVLFLLLH
jgi:Putative prokaryotic signal transducing protein